jgi:hypothetical protein
VPHATEKWAVENYISMPSLGNLMQNLDPVQEAIITVDDSWRRLLIIESKDKMTNGSIDIVTLRWRTSVDEFHRDASVLKDEIKDFKKEFRKNVDFFLLMVNRFKSSATSESFERLVRKVDEQGYEELIGRDEFRRMVIDKLREYF